jgi:hypothetical protein
MALSPELVGFVKEGLQRGLPREKIADVLLRAGWPPEQVTGAMTVFADLDFPIPVPRPITNVSTRDASMYVVMFLTLILSAYSLGDLLFELIDRTFPDPAANTYGGVSTMQAIRWSLATLIVTFPVFLYVSTLIGRTLRLAPTKRASKIRRQLTYTMLCIAACVLIGDFISVVYNFLGGELSVRFVLKVLTVAMIAGTTFLYYMWDLRDDEKEPET